MGGQAGSRGYIYQGIVAILESIINDDWEKIYVEYTSQNDKVDIALEKEDKLIKTIQVKSSINQFTKKNINEWICALITDEVADEYQLCLLGNCETNAEVFIRSIQKYYKGQLDDKSNKSLGKFVEVLSKYHVTIKLLNNDEDALLACVRDALNQYISKRNCFVSYETLDILANALTYGMMLLGTKGSYEEKDNYEERIFSWLKQTSNGELYNTGKFSEYKVFGGYVAGTFIEEYKPTKIEDFIGYISHKDNLLNQGRLLIDKIAAIELQKYDELEVDKDKKADDDLQSFVTKSGLELTPAIQQDIMNIFKFHSAEKSSKRKAELKENIKDIWKIEIIDDFFYVGNLLEKNDAFSFEYKGTDVEKNKADLLSDLEEVICKLHKMDALQYVFKDKYFLRLCLKNISLYSDDNITLQIENADCSSKFYSIQNETVENKELLDVLSDALLRNNEDLIKMLLLAKSNDSVSVEKIKQNPLRLMPKYNIYGRERYRFNDLCNAITDYIAEENNGYVSYSISSLRAGEAKWLYPWIVLSNTNSTFNLHYKILSSNTDGNCEGDISVQI